jgi:hypothetical protein
MAGYFDTIADKLKDVKPPIQRRYCAEGVHILGILGTRMNRSTRLGKPDTFIADFYSLQSSNPAQEVGAKVQWAPSMAWDGTLRDIMSFVAAVAKVRFEEVSIAHLNAITQDGTNPLYGRIVKVIAHGKDRSDKGKSVFTIHDWYQCPGDIEPAMLEKFKELTKPTAA